MKKYKRIFVIVMDSLGVGELSDAEDYGDAGTNTLGHIAQTVGGLHIPNLQALGLANLCSLEGVAPADRPKGYFTRLREASTGKDP